MRVDDLNIGDEISGTRIVYMSSYFDRANPHQKIFNFIGLTKKGSYRLFRSDSSGILYNLNIFDKDLKVVILESIELMKKEIKLKHHG